MSGVDRFNSAPPIFSHPAPGKFVVSERVLNEKISKVSLKILQGVQEQWMSVFVFLKRISGKMLRFKIILNYKIKIKDRRNFRSTDFVKDRSTPLRKNSADFEPCL